MCSIIGAVLNGMYDERDIIDVNRKLDFMWAMSHARGRDGRGRAESCYTKFRSVKSTLRDGADGLHTEADKAPSIHQNAGVYTMIGNMRAEPTTEYVAVKRDDDQQPYSLGGWHIVHNGTIANDKELRTGKLSTSIDSAAIVEQLNGLPPNINNFLAVVQKLRGSYAILAVHDDQPGVVYVACNYRPIWYAKDKFGHYIASSRETFPSGMSPQMLPAYSATTITANGVAPAHPLYAPWSPAQRRALVVCSGGLDSVVAATYAQKRMKMEVELIHFQYGSRAEGPEVKAVQAVAEALGVKCTLFPLPVYKPSDSPLLQADSPIAGGEAGAEFAHEWVPARNLLLLSVATAYAEANGFGVIVLGNNLEEAGAYPDNEPEFIDRFNDLLPFAVGDGKRVRVVMPVGNRMKHEIVQLGHELGAPMHLTWSCYRAGEFHCGTCGPCFMRRTAFKINQLTEVIGYADEPSE